MKTLLTISMLLISTPVLAGNYAFYYAEQIFANGAWKYCYYRLVTSKKDILEKPKTERVIPGDKACPTMIDLDNEKPEPKQPDNTVY